MDLCEFLPGGPLNFKILTIESSLYLPKLRTLFPNAELSALTNYEEVANYESYKNLRVGWKIAKDIKIFPEKYFDIVLAESLLATTKNSYDDLMAISRTLKDTGFFLGSFINIRYAPILSELKEGRFPFRDERPFAKDEVVKMLNDAVFKEISFVPMEQDKEDTYTAKTFIDAGFENFSRDLSTKSWMFKAARSTAAVIALKELYTEPVRKELARILHRIEFDVNTSENLSELWRLTEKEQIFPDYLLGFIEEISVYKKDLLQVLLLSAKDKGLNDFALEIERTIR